VHIATYFLVVHVLAKGHVNNMNNHELNDKYKPFVRNDIHKWSIFWQFPFYITFWPRVALGCLNTFLVALLTMLFMIGVDIEKPHLDISPTRKALIKFVVGWGSRSQLFISGMFWYNLEYVSSGEGNYKKWLGPEWKPEW